MSATDRDPTPTDIAAMALQAHTASAHGPDALSRTEAQDAVTSMFAVLRAEGFILLHSSELENLR